jgi:predicted transcriptional regulator
MTTTIRLDKELRARIATCADREGKSAHAFMLEAIERSVEALEHDARMRREGLARLERMKRTGEVIEWSEMSRWLEAKARKKSARAPRTLKRDR